MQLDHCLQTRYLKICSNIPSKFHPASPQSISQPSSTTGTWSFLPMRAHLTSNLCSGVLTGLAETAPAVCYSLKLCQFCLPDVHYSLKAFPAYSFPSLFMFHRHYFQYTFHTSTPFQELLHGKLKLVWLSSSELQPLRNPTARICIQLYLLLLDIGQVV